MKPKILSCFLLCFVLIYLFIYLFCFVFCTASSKCFVFFNLTQSRVLLLLQQDRVYTQTFGYRHFWILKVI